VPDLLGVVDDRLLSLDVIGMDPETPVLHALTPLPALFLRD
jgi:hypothetical protein